MKTATMTALISICLLLSFSATNAEKWINTGMEGRVDVDSIQKNADGLVYFNKEIKSEDENGPFSYAGKSAFDCVNGLSYPEYLMVMNPTDWKSKGIKVNPGTIGTDLMNFVCSRAP